MKLFNYKACLGLWFAGLTGTSALSFAAGSDMACDLPARVYGAEYRITQEVGNSKDVVEAVESLKLLRSQSRVMHIHPETGLADMWERNAKGAVHFSRFYDQEQRGIEFYQSATVEPASQFTWDQAWQLVPETVMTNNSPQAVEQQAGCARVETYQYTQAGAEYELQWLSEHKLVLAMHMVRDGQRVSWTMEDVVKEADALARAQQQRAVYITIDFADLGDQESDPFFRSMKHGHTAGHP